MRNAIFVPRSLCWLSFLCRNLITLRERIRSAKGVRSECRPCRKCTINLALVSSRKWRYSRDDWRGVDGKKFVSVREIGTEMGKCIMRMIFSGSRSFPVYYKCNRKRQTYKFSYSHTFIYIMYIILRKEFAWDEYIKTQNFYYKLITFFKLWVEELHKTELINLQI